MHQQRHAPLGPPPKRGSNVPWRLVIGIGAVAIFAIIGAIASRGTTTASSIAVGDCFEDPGLEDFASVKDQDCATAHDIQVYARVKDVPAGLIASGSTDPQSAGSRCEEELFDVLSSPQASDPSVVIPDDAIMTWFGDTDVSRSGDVLCAIESPSGALVGSVVP